MKRATLTSIMLLFITISNAQIFTPVRWSYGIKKISANEYQIHFKADIDDGWHLYAQVQPKNAVAKPTKIVFNSNKDFETIGEVKELGDLQKILNKDVNIGANQYEHTVDFVQLVRLKTKPPLKLTGVITFQTCTDKRCLAPEGKPFTVPIK